MSAYIYIYGCWGEGEIGGEEGINIIVYFEVLEVNMIRLYNECVFLII